MAGDWIKMRPALLSSPKVNGIARFLEDNQGVARALSTGPSASMNEIVTRNVMRYVTVSSLLCVWGAANEHTSDGVFHNADLSDLDDIAGIPGFGEAMESVGWAISDPSESTVTLPNFEEYNTCGKSRGAERQKRYRDRQKAQKSDVTRDVTPLHREEKRREESKTTAQSGQRREYPPDFERAWAAYPRRHGDNPKHRALKAWNARLREGHTAQEMTEGVQRYAEWCDATGKTGQETVKQAATFFGPDKGFTEEWGARPQRQRRTVV